MVKREPRMAEDPVVGEVRSIRAGLWREAGGTVGGLIRLLDQRKRPRRKPAPVQSKRTARRLGSR